MQNNDDEDGEITFTGAGEVVRRYRKNNKLTLEDLAAKLGDLSASKLSRCENDELPLSDQLVKRIADLLGVNPAALMLDCLKHLRPKLPNSPFGQLLEDLVKDIE